MDFLVAVLQKMAAIDREGYFQIPVDEKLHHAPNYYKIIKQPLCFQEMKKRLASGFYSSFRHFREDFELICSNAKTFNKSSTKVFKAAGLLLQKGSKVLDQHELEIRKAFAMLAAENAAPGPTAAASGLDAAVRHHPSAFHDNHHHPHPAADLLSGHPSATINGLSVRTRLPAGTPPPPPPLAQISPHSQLPMHPGPKDPTTHALYSDSQTHPQDYGFSMLPPVARQQQHSSGYAMQLVSDAEDDEEGDVLCSYPPDHPRQLESLESVLLRIRTAAPYCSWAVQPGVPPSSSAMHHQQPPNDTEEPSPRATASEAADAGPRSVEWREVRRRSEWQARWLELRLRELGAQRRRLQQQLAALAPGPGGAPPPPQQQQQVEGQAEGSGAGQQWGLGRSAVQKMRPAVQSCTFMQLRATTPTAGAAGLASSPMAAHRQSAAPSEQMPSRGAAPMSTDATAPTSTLTPTLHASPAAASIAKAAEPSSSLPLSPAAASAADDRQTPALVYAACELLSQRLLELRSRLTEAYPGLNRPMGAGGTGRSGRAGGGSASRRLSSGRLAKAGGGGESGDLASGAKRKRSESDALDGLGSPMLRSGASMDKAPSAIYIPPVRDLPEPEQAARLYASTTWNDAYHTHGYAALDQVPPEVEAVLLDDLEGSSSEDTSDELYTHMHRVLEEEEHKRYASVTAEGGRKRANKAPGKGHGQGQAPGGGAQGNGLKTPRSHHAQAGPGSCAPPHAASQQQPVLSQHHHHHHHQQQQQQRHHHNHHQHQQQGSGGAAGSRAKRGGGGGSGGPPEGDGSAAALSRPLHSRRSSEAGPLTLTKGPPRYEDGSPPASRAAGIANDFARAEAEVGGEHSRQDAEHAGGGQQRGAASAAGGRATPRHGGRSVKARSRSEEEEEDSSGAESDDDGNGDVSQLSSDDGASAASLSTDSEGQRGGGRSGKAGRRRLRGGGGGSLPVHMVPPPLPSAASKPPPVVVCMPSHV